MACEFAPLRHWQNDGQGTPGDARVVPEEMGCYPLVMSNIAIEHGNLQVIYP